MKSFPVKMARFFSPSFGQIIRCDSGELVVDGVRVYSRRSQSQAASAKSFCPPHDQQAGWSVELVEQHLPPLRALKWVDDIS